MSKEAYYFSHDSNARNDEKVLSLRMKHGMEGYGIYWAIVEMLRDTKEYLMQMDCDRIAFELHSDCKIIESVIRDFQLFEINSDYFYSESLLRRMKLKEEKSEKARGAALKRWGKDANALQTDCEGNAIKGKETKKKLKEIKEKEKKDKVVKLKEIKKECNDLEYITLNGIDILRVIHERLKDNHSDDFYKKEIQRLGKERFYALFIEFWLNNHDKADNLSAYFTETLKEYK